MIESIHIKNFFSFKDVMINLNENENILIGINGSGKSNFFKAIRLLKEGINGSLKKLLLDEWGGYDDIVCYGSANEAENINIIYELKYDELSKQGYQFTENVFYSITIAKTPNTSNFYIKEKIEVQKNDNLLWSYLDFTNGRGTILETNKRGRGGISGEVEYSGFDSQELALSQINDPDRYYALSTIVKAISEWIAYDYFDTTPGSKIRKPMLPTSERRLLSDGSNLPQVLNTIKINDKKSYKRIVKLLNDVNEKYIGFDFNLIGSNVELMLEESGLNRSIHVTHISDGTLRFLCLLAVCYNPQRGNLVCIDEPELGLHPDMIMTIKDAIIEAAKESQMIIATHSEHILNAFQLENILVFEKDDENNTTVSKHAEEEFKNWYEEEFRPGRMWRQGDIGGN